LSEVLEDAFSRRLGYTLVRADDGLESLAETVAAERPDFVVVPLKDDELPRECHELIDEWSRVTVVGVQELHGGARLVQLTPITPELSDVAPNELIDRIEEVAGQTAG